MSGATVGGDGKVEHREMRRFTDWGQKGRAFRLNLTD
jgi:hypothetical protein